MRRAMREYSAIGLRFHSASVRGTISSRTRAENKIDPQGLKPRFPTDSHGTAEVVLFPKPFYSNQRGFSDEHAWFNRRRAASTTASALISSNPTSGSARPACVVGLAVLRHTMLRVADG